MGLSRRELLHYGLVAGCSAACGPRQGSARWAEKRAPAIRVNQLGYFPRGPKRAVVKTSIQHPLEARLVHRGATVWRGHTRPTGLDEASGDELHALDFSSAELTGESFTLSTEVGTSFPFAISDELYRSLTQDAFKYFYHNRSGVSIVVPFVPDQTWTRPAGHVSDASVACWGSQTCDYRLDVSGGWYDAGDHGKYVVNGGIAVWTLLALYERWQTLGRGPFPFPDGAGHIPQSGDGVPDLLSEARFELEFLLKMQVPRGEFVDMAHHKIHDHAWTPLAIEPPATSSARGLHPPSTAATLNLAAVAAQAARIYETFDPTFAKRCLSAAQRAFAAAERHPARFAPRLDSQGGGPYDDRYVSDEFFWAAAELFITTGHDAYLERLSGSPHFRRFPTRLELPDGTFDGDGVSTSLSWQSTAALGWISLAVVPSRLGGVERERLREGVVAAGRVFQQAAEKEGYLVPLSLGASKQYPWGSNSCVLNNLLVLSLAHDFSQDRSYAEAVASGMDYLLGRNPLEQCYVSGYGSVPLRHPHHRFWAEQLSGRFPPPPPGAISGGPNSSLQDPQTKKMGLTRTMPPQKCFVDDIEAWSVNEVAINWNAPLVWVCAFLDEWRGG